MMASGTWSFHAFCATIDVPETRQPNIFTTHIIPGKDDDDSFQPMDPVEPPPQDNYQEKPQDTLDDLAVAVPQTTLIDLGPITHMIPEDQETMSLDRHDKLLQWNYQLGQFALQLHQATGSTRTTAKMPTCLQETILCHLPV